MAAEGTTRVRFTPISGSLRLGLLAYGLPELTGSPVAASAVLTYLTLVTAARTGAGLAVSAAVLAHELRTLSPRRLTTAAIRPTRHSRETPAASTTGSHPVLEAT